MIFISCQTIDGCPVPPPTDHAPRALAGSRLGWTVRLLLCCPAKLFITASTWHPASIGTANFVTKKISNSKFVPEAPRFNLPITGHIELSVKPNAPSVYSTKKKKTEYVVWADNWILVVHQRASWLLNTKQRDIGYISIQTGLQEDRGIVWFTYW